MDNWLLKYLYDFYQLYTCTKYLVNFYTYIFRSVLLAVLIKFQNDTSQYSVYKYSNNFVRHRKSIITLHRSAVSVWIFINVYILQVEIIFNAFN